jgi:hypothetical protein
MAAEPDEGVADAFVSPGLAEPVGGAPRGGQGGVLGGGQVIPASPPAVVVGHQRLR